jgi:outer membrane protein assembly factor BamB
MKKHGALIVTLIFVVCSVSVAADWPQYLGPDRNAVSTETGMLRSWPAEGPEVMWTVPLGPGYGGAAVSNGKVYILDRTDGGQDLLRCIDLTAGRQEWAFAYDAPDDFDHPGSRSVPTIEGNYIYTCGSNGHLHCIDIQTKKAVWTKNIWTDFGGGRLPRWGIAQNPLIVGDMVILASQTGSTGVVAYDKLSGDVKWTSPKLPGRTGYVSPKLITIGGEDQLVMISANGVVMGMAPESGAELWSYDGWQCKIPAANVTEIGDGRLFITGGYEAGSAMIKVEKDGADFLAKELYIVDYQDFGTHVHPAILYEEHLYAHCSTNDTKDGMVCMDLEGTVKWETKRSPLFDKGGFLLADGLMFSIDGNKGILYLIEPNPDGFKELASAKLLDSRECWAPLALSDGKLLIRDQKQMKCVVVGE